MVWNLQYWNVAMTLITMIRKLEKEIGNNFKFKQHNVFISGDLDRIKININLGDQSFKHDYYEEKTKSTTYVLTSQYVKEVPVSIVSDNTIRHFIESFIF